MNTKPLQLLIVEDEAAHVEAIRRGFDAAGSQAEIRAVGTLREYRELIVASPPDLALVDLNLPDGRAVEVLTHPPADAPFPILVMTAFGNQQIVVEVMKAGALDYVVKSPEAFATLPQTVTRALREWRLLQKEKQAEATLRASNALNASLLQTMPMGMEIVDETGNILFQNATLVQAVGKPSLGQKCWLVYYDDQQPCAACPLKEPIKIGETRTIERAGVLGGRFFEITHTGMVYQGQPAVMEVFHDITERQQAAVAIRESEKRFMDVLYAAHDAILLINGEKFVDCNEATARMLGYSNREAFLLSHPSQLSPPVQPDGRESFAKANEMMQTAIANGFHRFEWVHRRANGEDFPVEVSLTAISYGAKIMLHCLWRDLTERQRMEAELARLNAHHELILSSAAEGIIGLDLQGNHTFVNPAAARMLGCTAEELIGRPSHSLWHHTQSDGNPYPKEACNIYASYQDGKVHHSSDEVFWRKDGTRFFVEYDSTPLHEAGRLAGAVLTFMDITARKLAEDSHARLAMAVEQAAETIVITDTQGVILYVNPAFEKNSGYTRAEALGQNPRILKSGKHDAEFYRHLWAVLTAGQVWTGHLINRRKDGTLYEEDASISPVLDAAGKIVHYVAVKRDVTEQKKLETQFLRAQRMESVGRLAGGIAHDLNNILAPILMGASLLQEGLSPEEAGPLIDAMADSAQRGADIIKQLLTFARGTEGKKVPLPPGRLINEMAAIVRETFPKSITLRLESAQHLWPVLGDPTQCHQVLLNLCVNARDAMPNGGTLTLAAENLTLDDCYASLNPEAKAGPYVVLQVSDTGTGMTPEIMDQIFDPFFTTKGLELGTGLGLATVQGIVKSHEGFIQVESEVGHGTRFKVYLPAQPAADTGAAATPAQELPQGHGELVLVVDDEQNVRDITGRILKKHGYRVLTATDGARAVGLYAQHRAEIQVVLTDLLMPVMDGPATMRVLRQMNPQIKIIATSGAASKVKLAELANLSVQAYLPKPFTTERLLVTLEQVLHGAGQRQEAGG